MSKNTLYITFDGLSDPLGQSQILPYLKGIAAQGYQVHIISCEKKKRLPSEISRIKDGIKDLPIRWDYILYDEGGGILTRWRYVWQLKAIAKKIISEKPIGLIHCRSYLASLIGLEFHKKKDIPFIFDMRGFWADERIDGGIWNKRNLSHWILFRYFKQKEKECLQRSAAIISLTVAGIEELDKQNKQMQLPAKTTVIPCCTDTALFSPSRFHDDKKPSEHIIIYTGSIGTWYYTREMIDCMLVWRKKIPGLRLQILTKDNEALDEILAGYDSAVIGDLIIRASASYSEVPQHLSRARASVFFIKPAYSKIASSPTKMAECWAMGLPIITNSGIGDNDHYFIKKKGGILLRQFTEAEYEYACQQYLSEIRSTDHYRNIALADFDNRTAIKKYLSIYDKLTEAYKGK